MQLRTEDPAYMAGSFGLVFIYVLAGSIPRCYIEGMNNLGLDQHYELLEQAKRNVKIRRLQRIGLFASRVLLAFFFFGLFFAILLGK